MKLYRETPLTQAVLKLFEQLSRIAEDEYEDLEPGSVKAYVFGGAAVHIYTNSRGSHDVDVEFDALPKLESDDVYVKYVDSDGEEKALTFDSTFSPVLGPLHEDYIVNAVPLSESGDSVIWVYLVSALDLAVSKLGRFADHDKADIVALAESDYFTIDEFEGHALEALGYFVGGVGQARVSLEQAIRAIKENV